MVITLKNARRDTVIEVVNIEKSPKTIEFFYDEAFALLGILRIVRKIKNQYDGIMINCFADPGLKPTREVCDIPVVEPAATALKTLEILIDLIISHSKTGLYIIPEVGKIIGY